MELNQSNYYSQEANELYFSVSQYKDFSKCEAMALAKIRGEYERPMTKALLVGSFVDSYFEGTLPEFMAHNPEIFNRKKELKSEFRKANEIIGKATKDPLFSRYMSGDKQVIMRFQMFGADWKIKMEKSHERSSVFQIYEWGQAGNHAFSDVWCGLENKDGQLFKRGMHCRPESSYQF